MVNSEATKQKAQQTVSGIAVHDPRTGTLISEKVCGETAIRWAYSSPAAPLLQRLLFRNRWASRLLGAFFDSRWSKKRIPDFVKNYDINLAEAIIPPGGFRSFNDFFSRKLKPESRPFEEAPDILSSPADCRALVFPEGLSGNATIPVKGLTFTLTELLGKKPEERQCFLTEPTPHPVVICRLCPVDYHRFHFPAGGRETAAWEVPGYYHSVNPHPLRLGIRVFASNYRHVSMLELAAFGPCAYVEVGAFGVSRVCRTHTEKTFVKMAEKGFFQFGGSTIVLVFSPGAVAFREDIVQWSSKGIETLLKAGDTLGTTPSS